MANGYFTAQFEQNGASDYTPKTGNESTVATYGLQKYFPVQTTKPSLTPNPMERTDELRNYDQDLQLISDIYDPTWTANMRAYPDTLGYWLATILGRDTTAGYSVAAGASATDLDNSTALATGQYAHTWTAPFGPAGAIPGSTQLRWAYKDQSTFYEMRGCATENLAIATPDNGGVTVAASGPGTYLTNISDPSLTPAYESAAIRPFTHASLAITQSGSAAPSGSGVNSGFSVNINNPVNAIRTLGIGSAFPDRLEKDDAPINVSGTIDKRNLTANDWAAMRDLSLFQILAKWTSTQCMTGSSGAKYGFSITSQAQLVGGDMDDLQSKRRHGSNFQWKAVYDGTTNSAVIKLVNKTATYAA